VAKDLQTFALISVKKHQRIPVDTLCFWSLRHRINNNSFASQQRITPTGSWPSTFLIHQLQIEIRVTTPKKYDPNLSQHFYGKRALRLANP
jgi:hypothetical protein